MDRNCIQTCLAFLNVAEDISESPDCDVNLGVLPSYCYESNLAQEYHDYCVVGCNIWGTWQNFQDNETLPQPAGTLGLTSEQLQMLGILVIAVMALK